MNEVVKEFTYMLVFIIIGIYWLYKHFAKDSDSIIEKLLLITICFSLAAILTLYCLDYFNIPTILNWVNGIDTKNWINNIFMIISAVLGGVIVLVSTRWQIEKSEESNRERDKEENRLKYMPLLKYEFLDNCRLNNVEEFIMFSKKDKGCYFNIIMKIENIGLAPIRNMYIKSRGDNIYETSHNFENNGILKIDESVYSLFATQLPEGSQKVCLEIIYQDILSNAYSQVIEFDVDIDRSNMNKPSSYTYKINKETIIKDNNIKDSLNNKII